MYEIRNKLKYDYFTADPYACMVDYPSYETNKKNKALPLSGYYSGKTERHTPDYAANNANPAFPHLKGEWTSDKYNCVQARTIDSDLINPQVLYGETDILFDSEKIRDREKQRRMMSYNSKFTPNVQIPVLRK